MSRQTNNKARTREVASQRMEAILQLRTETLQVKAQPKQIKQQMGQSPNKTATRLHLRSTSQTQRPERTYSATSKTLSIATSLSKRRPLQPSMNSDHSSGSRSYWKGSRPSGMWMKSQVRTSNLECNSSTLKGFASLNQIKK